MEVVNLCEFNGKLHVIYAQHLVHITYITPGLVVEPTPLKNMLVKFDHLQ